MPKTTSIATTKHLRAAYNLWQNLPVVTSEGGDLILPLVMTGYLEELFESFGQDLKEEGLIAQNRSEQMHLRGTSEGRKKIPLPDVELLKARLVRTPLIGLAREFGVTRQTLKHHIKGGYMKKGQWVSYAKAGG